jgi:hypothetical protein
VVSCTTAPVGDATETPLDAPLRRTWYEPAGVWLKSMMRVDVAAAAGAGREETRSHNATAWRTMSNSRKRGLGRAIPWWSV